MRIPAHRLGLPVLENTGTLLSEKEWRTANGVILPTSIVRLLFERFNAPILAPHELIPPSVEAGAMGGRVLHLPSPRERVPANPSEGQCCDDCAFFRYDAGQELMRRDSAAHDALRSLGPRGPRSEDMGLCAHENRASDVCLTARWWGRDCSDYREAGTVLTSADPRRGRRFAPLTP